MSNPWLPPGEPSSTPSSGERDELFDAVGGGLVGAGFGIRALARIIDWVAGMVVYFAASQLVMEAGVGSLGFLGDDVVRVVAYSIIAGLVPPVFSTWLAGVTPGKLILGLRVVPASGEGAITVGQSLGRELAYFVDSLFFALPAYFSMQDSPRQQRLGDKWAGTMVRFRRDLGPGRYSAQNAGLVVGVAIGLEFVIDAGGMLL